jgi:DegV family protein with EDD domain
MSLASPSPDPSSPTPEAPGTRPVAVVTDTTTYAPAEMLDGLGVKRVSLYVGWDDNQRREDEYQDLDRFYERLRESETLPTTSQPSIGDFTAVYEPLLAAGNDIYSIHIASGLSGTLESAREAARSLAARDDLPGVIAVVDGQTGAGGLGCLVIAAAEAARAGATLDAVGGAVAGARSELDIWFCLDTLEYLRRGGRIGAARALLGSALRIKPILTFGTEITPVSRVRTRARALERMEAYLVELRQRDATDWVVQHAQQAADAEHLVARGTEILGKPPLFCTQVGPVLGAHLGSGLLVGGMHRT